MRYYRSALRPTTWQPPISISTLIFPGSWNMPIHEGLDAGRRIPGPSGVSDITLAEAMIVARSRESLVQWWSPTIGIARCLHMLTVHMDTGQAACVDTTYGPQT
jgi:hypothetical protein